MLFMMQILNRLTDDQLRDFDNLFDDLSFELEEMGYKDEPEELINSMLENHFNMSFDTSEEASRRQLRDVTACILNKKYKSAIAVTRMRKAA